MTTRRWPWRWHYGPPPEAWRRWRRPPSACSRNWTRCSPRGSANGRARCIQSPSLCPAATARPAVDVLTRIAAACRDNLRLKFSYKDREGKASARNLEPLRLAHTGRRWYLVAWDVDREDWRTFRVDRVQQVSSVGAQFVPRKFPGDIVEYVSRSIKHTSYTYRIRLKLKGTPEGLSKQLPPWCGELGSWMRSTACSRRLPTPSKCSSPWC